MQKLSTLNQTFVEYYSVKIDTFWCFEPNIDNSQKINQLDFDCQKMKIFHSSFKCLEIVGINCYQSLQSNPFNTRNVISLIISVSSVITNSAFLFFKANAFYKLTESFYISCSLFVGTTVSVNFILNMRIFFELINNIENVIQKSE